MPDWFKNFQNQSVEPDPHPNLKHCRGLVDLYANGIMLPSWCEIRFDIGEIGSEFHTWQFADWESRAEVHGKSQFPKQIKYDNLAHVKLFYPWRLVCKEEIQWSWQAPSWNDFDNFAYKVIPGVTEYKYQHNLHINLIFQRQLQSYKYLMKHNIPLAHLIPISSRRKINIKYECVSDQEFNKLETPKVTFINNHLNQIKLRKGN